MILLRTLLPLLALCLFLPPNGLSQWSNNSAVNTPVCTISDASFSQILRTCSDGAGGVLLVWGDKRKEKTNIGGDLFVQRLNALGIPQWTTNGVMICDTTGEQYAPCIISDNAGGAIIAWVDARTGQYTGNIYVQHVDAPGQALWGRQGKQITTGNTWFNPSIASDGAGGAFIAYRYGVVPAGIYAQRISSDGTVLWAANGITISPSGYHDYPVIAADDSGGAHIAWLFTRSDGAYNGYIQRITSSGVKRFTTNGVAFRVQAATQGRPLLENMGGGEALVAWYDERASTRQVFVQRFTWNGTAKFAAGGKAVTDGLMDAYYLVMSKDGVGGVFIAYMYGNVLRAIGVKGDGLVRWDSSAGVVLCSAANERSFGSILNVEPGRAVVAWSDKRASTMTDYNADLYAQTIDTLGHSDWTTDGISFTTAARDQFVPVLVPTGSHAVIAAWMDDRTGNASGAKFNIYAQRIDSQGGLTGVVGEGSVPAQCSLIQNFPNPFNPTTVVSYQVSVVSVVSLRVYDLLGREVATLVNEERMPGTYSVKWNADGMASGIYFYQLRAGGAVITRKMVLMR